MIENRGVEVDSTRIISRQSAYYTGVVFVKFPLGNKWLLFPVLAILLPIGLLASFKLTGMMGLPAEPETITLTSINWTIQKPSDFQRINQAVGNNYSDDGLVFTASLQLYTYLEDTGPGLFWDLDNIAFSFSVNLTVESGFASSFRFAFDPADQSSFVLIYTDEWAVTQENVTVTQLQTVATHESSGLVEAQVMGSPCFLAYNPCYWAFSNDSSQDYVLKASFEVVHFNGTASRRVFLPMILTVKSGDS